MEHTLAALRALLGKGELPSERELAKQINVNRHQIRRALQVLRESNELPAPGARRAAAALGSGVLARDTNPLEVIEVRMALEPALARLAALRASPLDITRIQRAAEAAADLDTGASDLAFHKAIGAAAGNKLAAGLYFLVREIGRDARLRIGSSNAPLRPERVVQRNAEHRAIAEAIAGRDPEAAERAMRVHLASVHKLVIARLTPDTSTAAAS